MRLILDELASCEAQGAVFLFDEPVSNSGNACWLVHEIGNEYRMDIEAKALEQVDAALSGSARVITSDSAILDACKSWYNLDALIVSRLARTCPDRIWTVDIFSGQNAG